MDKDTVLVGKSVVARVTVKNNSKSNLKNIPVSFFLNRKQIGTQKVSIRANSSSPVTFQYVAKKTGNYILLTYVIARIKFA